MKKLAILFAMMFAVALWFGSTASATETTADVNEFTDPEEVCSDTLCEAGVTDIKSVSATSDGSDIVVTVVTCGAFDDFIDEKRMVKYRLHIDHKSPGSDRYEDGDEFTPDDEDTEDDCETSSDDGVKFRVHKNKAAGSSSAGNESNGRVYGPGTVDESNTGPYTLTFTVPYAGLLDDAELPEDREAVAAGDVVHLWVDVQQKQICDRAPNTFIDDEEPFDDTCAKPEETDEVLSILLQQTISIINNQIHLKWQGQKRG